MKSVERLVAEHDVIERALKVLEIATVRIDAGQAVPTEFPSWVPEFSRSLLTSVITRKKRICFFHFSRNAGSRERAVRSE